MNEEEAARLGRMVQQKTGNLYTLKVYLIAGMIIDEEYEGKEISRKIQIRGDQSLDILHQAIFQAYERFDEHLYAFFIGKGKERQGDLTYPPQDFGNYEIFEPRYGIPEEEMKVTQDADTLISELNLVPGDAFIYVFDFADQWLHAILVERVDEAPAGQEMQFPRIVEAIGNAPPQYPEIEEEYEEEEAGEYPGSQYSTDFQELKLDDLDEFMRRFIKPDSEQQ